MSELTERLLDAEERLGKAETALDAIARVLGAAERAHDAAERASAHLRTVSFVLGGIAVVSIALLASRRSA